MRSMEGDSGIPLRPIQVTRREREGRVTTLPCGGSNPTRLDAGLEAHGSVISGQGLRNVIPAETAGLFVN